MKVNRPSEKRLKKQLNKWRESGDVSSDTSADGAESFQESVQEQEIELLDMEVHDLVEELEKRGQALVNHPSVIHIRQYQQAMASFLKKSLELSKEIERMTGRRNIQDIKEGKEKKEHVIVNTIDEKMEVVAENILNQETDNLNLVDRVGELQGLVVDLVSTINDSDEGASPETGSIR